MGGWNDVCSRRRRTFPYYISSVVRLVPSISMLVESVSGLLFGIGTIGELNGNRM